MALDLPLPPPSPRRLWTASTALETLARVIEREGRVPAKYELADLGAPSATTLRKHFGTRSRAVRMAEELIA